jgi:hypothetical protein
VFDPIKGTFTPGPDIVFVTLATKPVVDATLKSAERQVERLGRALVSWYRARAGLASLGYERNFWRASDCARFGVDEIECIDEFKALSATSILSKLGFAQSEVESGIGAIEVQNAQIAATPTVAQPSRITLRLPLPWGGTPITRVILEPTI